MIAKIGFSSPKYWHFLMRPMHQLPVPKEAKKEHETEGRDKCEEELFPVHKVFPVRCRLNPSRPPIFIAKPSSAVDAKILTTNRPRKMTKDETRVHDIRICFIIGFRLPRRSCVKARHSFVIRHSSFGIDSTCNPSSRKRPASTSAA